MHVKRLISFLLNASIFPMIIAQSAMLNIDSTLIYEYHNSIDSSCTQRKLFEYDALSNAIDSKIISYEYDNADWENIFHAIDSFDNYSNLISSEYYSYYPEGIISGVLKAVYEYNKDNNCTQVHRYLWVDSTQEWTYRSEINYYFDDSGRRDSSYGYKYNVVNNEWYLSGISYDSYYEDGNHRGFYNLLLDEDSMTWDYSIKWEYTYENSLKSSWITYNWDSDSLIWTPNLQHLYEYDQDGRLLLEKLNRWNISNNDWKKDYLKHYAYDNEGRKLYFDDLRWNLTSGMYDTSKINRYEYFPELGYNIETYYKRNNSLEKTLPNYKFIRYFDEWDVGLYDVIYNWDTEISDWYLSRKKYHYRSYQVCDSIGICNGDTLVYNGSVYTKEGDYNIALQAIDGRDSIVHLHLSLKPSPAIEGIHGDTIVDEYSEYVYSVQHMDSVDYYWNIENGNIISNPDSSKIIIEWGTDGSGKINCIALNSLGCYSIPVELKISILDTRVELSDNTEDFLVYPNPTRSLIFLESKGSSLEYDYLSFYKTDGTLVKKIDISETKRTSVNVEEFSSGLYLLLIRNSATGELKWKKIAVE